MEKKFLLRQASFFFRGGDFFLCIHFANDCHVRKIFLSKKIGLLHISYRLKM